MVSDALRHMATRVESDEFFAASQIAAYRELSGQDDKGICTMLGISDENPPPLKLCGRLRPEDVQVVADDLNCRTDILAEIAAGVFAE
jgi:hypothetical protein